VTRVAERAVVVLGRVALIAWLASYSWLLGAVIPMDGIDLAVSPSLVAGSVALVVGATAVAVALAGSVEGMPVTRRARAGAVMGGAVAALSLPSLAL
jgi:hypothetical protein